MRAGADDDDAHAKHAGFGEGFVDAAGAGVRTAQAGADQGGDQGPAFLVAGFFDAMPGDPLLEFRAVAADVFVMAVAADGGGAEIPLVAAYRSCGLLYIRLSLPPTPALPSNIRSSAIPKTSATPSGATR
nr:hypothetical protein [uncultured Rhodopila sp.]